MTKDQNHTEQPVSGAMTDFVQWLNTQRDLSISESFHEIIARVTVLLSRAQDAQAVRNAALREAARYVKDMGEPLFIEEGILALQSAPAQPVESQYAVELPPLPEPFDRLVGHPCEGSPVFTADQMREYALAALSQVRGKAMEPFCYYTDWHPTGRKWANEPHEFDDEHARLRFDDVHKPEDYWFPLYAAAPQVAQEEIREAAKQGFIAAAKHKQHLATTRDILASADKYADLYISRAAPQVAQEEGARNFRPSWIEHQLRRMYMLGASHRETDKPVAVKATEWATTIMAAAPQSDAQQSGKDQ